MIENIVLKPVTHDDAQLIVEMRNSEAVMKNFVIREPFTLDSQHTWITNFVESGKAAQYIIYLTTENKPVGSVYISNIDRQHSKGELGIFISDGSNHGKGVGTAAVNAILNIAFHELGLHRVYLRVFPENVGAVRSYEKAGFRYEGLLRETVFVEGEYRDMIIMSCINDRQGELCQHNITKQRLHKVNEIEMM